MDELKSITKQNRFKQSKPNACLNKPNQTFICVTITSKRFFCKRSVPSPSVAYCSKLSSKENLWTTKKNKILCPNFENQHRDLKLIKLLEKAAANLNAEKSPVFEKRTSDLQFWGSRLRPDCNIGRQLRIETQKSFYFLSLSNSKGSCASTQKNHGPPNHGPLHER